MLADGDARLTIDTATTMESHEALPRAGLRRRRPAICQKPMAPDIAACRRMVARAEGAGLALMVHEELPLPGRR